MAGDLNIGAVILAGGRGRRIGGDKAAMRLAGRPLADHVRARVAPQVAEVVLNGHGGLADAVPGQPGPLAGVLTALDWAGARGFAQVLTVPCDTPFLPADLVARLREGPSVAASGGRVHPVVGLWPVTLSADLRRALAQGTRRIGLWAETIGARQVTWAEAPDPFFNVNTAEDLATAARRAGDDPARPGSGVGGPHGARSR